MKIGDEIYTKLVGTLLAPYVRTEGSLELTHIHKILVMN